MGWYAATRLRNTRESQNVRSSCTPRYATCEKLLTRRELFSALGPRPHQCGAAPAELAELRGLDGRLFSFAPQCTVATSQVRASSRTNQRDCPGVWGTGHGPSVHRARRGEIWHMQVSQSGGLLTATGMVAASQDARFEPRSSYALRGAHPVGVVDLWTR